MRKRHEVSIECEPGQLPGLLREVAECIESGMEVTDLLRKVPIKRASPRTAAMVRCFPDAVLNTLRELEVVADMPTGKAVGQQSGCVEFCTALALDPNAAESIRAYHAYRDSDCATFAEWAERG